MSCFRQFQFYISNPDRYITAASGQFNYFTFHPNFPWNLKITDQFLNYTIQGFKNIDIYGVEMIGYVQSPSFGASCGIVEDYGFQIGITGQNGQISGAITRNDYFGITTDSTITLSKFQNKIMFEQPILSCTSLSIGNFSAAGMESEDPAQIRLDLNIQLYFYYKYEGE